MEHNDFVTQLQMDTIQGHKQTVIVKDVYADNDHPVRLTWFSSGVLYFELLMAEFSEWPMEGICSVAVSFLGPRILKLYNFLLLDKYIMLKSRVKDIKGEFISVVVDYLKRKEPLAVDAPLIAQFIRDTGNPAAKHTILFFDDCKPDQMMVMPADSHWIITDRKFFYQGNIGQDQQSELVFTQLTLKDSTPVLVEGDEEKETKRYEERSIPKGTDSRVVLSNKGDDSGIIELPVGQEIPFKWAATVVETPPGATVHISFQGPISGVEEHVARSLINDVYVSLILYAWDDPTRPLDMEVHLKLNEDQLETIQKELSQEGLVPIQLNNTLDSLIVTTELYSIFDFETFNTSRRKQVYLERKFLAKRAQVVDLASDFNIEVTGMPYQPSPYEINPIKFGELYNIVDLENPKLLLLAQRYNESLKEMDELLSELRASMEEREYIVQREHGDASLRKRKREENPASGPGRTIYGMTKDMVKRVIPFVFNRIPYSGNISQVFLLKNMVDSIKQLYGYLSAPTKK